MLTACKKVNDLPRTNPIGTSSSTITAIGGADQKDTVGKPLIDSIVVKINEPGSKLNKFFVHIFQKTLCNDDSTTIKKVVNGTIISYKWQLGGSPGVQTLKFKVLDSTQNVIDSINVTATAIAPSQGWHPSSCVVKKNLYVNAFAKLSTGRLLTGFSGDFYPYYSDDNGISWHPIKSYYFGYWPSVQKIIVLPNDEIFIGSELNGVFYSNDAGKTWSERTSGIPLITPINDLAATPDGRIVFTSDDGGIYISNNKGLSWSTIIDKAPPISIGHKYMATQANGDIYFTEVINFQSTLMLLDHTTLKLSPVKYLPFKFSDSFFIDKNGNIYVSCFNLSSKSAELYQSIDNGSNWTKVFSYPLVGNITSSSIVNISLQGDGNYYFEVLADDIYCYKTADFQTFQKLPVGPPGYSGAYILASNNYFLINSFPLSIQYYAQ